MSMLHKYCAEVEPNAWQWFITTPEGRWIAVSACKFPNFSEAMQALKSFLKLLKP
ncbi:hypothetical protein GGR90_000984 [Sphingopyxis italica]|uniref:DUF1508 domain-containing protein n=1 Tax=Sphingopyxis italica TaxID=1129133 RepID=A0A7X6B8K4_9SPHN|nr:hypothetical protein [Sphingopyxis italica]NJB88832.1 hypothetical protein [Sphingopyxis italica]